MTPKCCPARIHGSVQFSKAGFVAGVAASRNDPFWRAPYGRVADIPDDWSPEQALAVYEPSLRSESVPGTAMSFG